MYVFKLVAIFIKAVLISIEIELNLLQKVVDQIQKNIFVADIQTNLLLFSYCEVNI